ncbi:MAG: HupE/UreJ family protein [Myxococcota bacterium]
MTRGGLGALGVVLLFAAPAKAHPLAPAGFTLSVEGAEAELEARLPRRVALGERPWLELPADCREHAASLGQVAGAWVERSARYRCDEPLVGRAVRLVGVRPGGTTALLRVNDASEVLLDAEAPSAEVGVASPWRWMRVGAEHLLTGVDHVLLLVGLVLTLAWRRGGDEVVSRRVGGGRRASLAPLLSALLAFTAGHALALFVAVTLDARPPPELVEPAILATLVLVGLELPEGERSLVARAPIAVPLVVGLVHGCGFAGALRSLGGGPESVLRALVPFHVGLECAQVVVVVGLLGVERWWPVPRTAGVVLGGAGLALLLMRTLL